MWYKRVVRVKLTSAAWNVHARTFLEILTDELALRCLQQDGQAFYLTNKKGPVS
jgi:hypothetical protein